MARHRDRREVVDYSSRSDRDLLIIAVTQLDALRDDFDDHEARLTSLETRMPRLSAIATAIGGALGSAVPPVLHLFGH